MTWAGFLGFNSKFRVPSLTREAGGHVIVTSASVHTILTESERLLVKDGKEDDS